MHREKNRQTDNSERFAVKEAELPALDAPDVSSWFFFNKHFGFANKQQLLNVLSVMLLYIVYHGPDNLAIELLLRLGG